VSPLWWPPPPSRGDVLNGCSLWTWCGPMGSV